MKLILIVAVTFYIAEARIHSHLKDPSSNSYQTLNYNPRFCADTGLTCTRCAECHDNLQFGLCIKGATTSKCFCKWGWTGTNALKVNVPNGVSFWSKNRIRADNCKIPCHYTHDFW